MNNNYFCTTCNQNTKDCQCPKNTTVSEVALSDGLPGAIELVVDPIDERMDELAALTAAWQKNRDRNRPSPILRKAVIMAAGELWDTVALLEEEQAG